MEELIALGTSTGVFALLSAALGLGFRKRGKERAANLDGWIESNKVGMERERAANESHDKTVADIRAHHANVILDLKNAHATELSDAGWALATARQSADAERAEADVRIATLTGRLLEAHVKADKYDAIMKGHETHIGGKADVHGRGVEIVWQCPCGNLRFSEPARKTEETA